MAGLARATGLSKNDVNGVLAHLPADALLVTDGCKGRLYSTRRHDTQHRSTLSRILSVLADSPK